MVGNRWVGEYPLSLQLPQTNKPSSLSHSNMYAFGHLTNVLDADYVLTFRHKVRNKKDKVTFRV